MTKIQTSPPGDAEPDRSDLGNRMAEALAEHATKPQSVRDAEAYARAYQQVADFLSANPDLAKRANCDRYGVRRSVNLETDPAAWIARAGRRGRDAGAGVEEYAESQYGGVKLHFGPVCVEVYATAELVCQRVVVGMVQDVQYALIVDLDGNPREAAEASE